LQIFEKTEVLNKSSGKRISCLLLYLKGVRIRNNNHAGTTNNHHSTADGKGVIARNEAISVTSQQDCFGLKKPRNGGKGWVAV
jgi:hypothetical protein